MTSPATPFSNARCYACDADAVGVRDRRLEGGLVEAACGRHADPSIDAFRACAYCNGPRPSLVIEGVWCHVKCQREAGE